jgi:hypothetical protein
MTTPQNYHEELARKTGFKPFEELTEEQQKSVWRYVDRWYTDEHLNPTVYPEVFYWKESSVGDGNWIGFDVTPHNRIAAPHLKEE